MSFRGTAARRREEEHGILSVVIVAAFLATAYLIYGRIGTDLLPHTDEASISLKYYMPPRTLLAATDAVLQ